MIEKSPFHISHKRLDSTNATKFNQQVKGSSNGNNKSLKDSEPTFWDWFRGLVNPLQNLPIISGIYSSINSDNSESDRDLVQNSLGGFMYGGPIGAIAGFGNWVFNKLFDKTPTEMAFDLTGISNLWKDEKNKNTVVAKNEKNIANNSEKNKTNLSREWWNQNQFQVTRRSKSPSVVKPANTITESNNAILTNNSDIDLEQIATKYDNKELETRKKLVPLTNIDQSKTSNKESLVSSIQTLGEKTKIKKLPSINLNNSIGNKYRELNFDYPEWKPNDLEMSKKSSDKSKYLILQEKYLDDKPKKHGQNLNIKL